MTRRNKDLLLVALGLIMVAAGFLLRLTEQQQEQLAGENAALLLDELSQQRRTVLRDEPVQENPETDSGSGRETVMGYDVLGTLSIPSVNIELPVLNQWNYDLLNVSPCRYSGSIETGDLVVIGHSYRTHLRPLRQVQIGDTVELVDTAGTVHRYVVAETEILQGSDADGLSSDYPLTIFTCTADSHHRFLARCAKA